jgi:hybrid polyketide synthase/nonribosomal peptide synthetase ACE1
MILGPESYIFESKLHMLSPSGRSKMWDTTVDGYDRGESFAAVTLKPLNQSLKDGDHIECPRDRGHKMAGPLGLPCQVQYLRQL